MTSTPVTDRQFRSIAGRFATGVAVATSCAAGEPVGMTVNSFTTVSLEPRLLLVCLRSGCRLVTAVRRSGCFAITVLAADQRGTAMWFARRGRPGGAEGFAGIRYRPAVNAGCPVLTDGVAYFDCAAEGVQTAGDHVILVGAVRSAGLLRPADPLLFVDGRYAELAS